MNLPIPPSTRETILRTAIDHLKAQQRALAIATLERHLAGDPGFADGHALLGAQYAQTGKFDLACDELERALRADPALEVARFQLGLLHLTSGRMGPAAEVWQALDALGDQHPLVLFKHGLLALVDDCFDEARSALARGIELNRSNQALNVDMAAVIAKIDALVDGGAKM